MKKKSSQEKCLEHIFSCCIILAKLLLQWNDELISSQYTSPYIQDG